MAKAMGRLNNTNPMTYERGFSRYIGLVPGEPIRG
jgi:hypothetical protein